MSIHQSDLGETPVGINQAAIGKGPPLKGAARTSAAGELDDERVGRCTVAWHKAEGGGAAARNVRGHPDGERPDKTEAASASTAFHGASDAALDEEEDGLAPPLHQ